MRSDIHIKRGLKGLGREGNGWGSPMRILVDEAVAAGIPLGVFKGVWMKVSEQLAFRVVTQIFEFAAYDIIAELEYDESEC